MAASGFSLIMKKKHFKFDVKLEVEELSSVPFVSGVLFAKVRLLNGGSFTDFTNRIEVNENRVLWKKRFNFACKAVASVATGVLEPCMCRISVRKEMKGGRSYQKLGYADVNLALFAGAGRTSRRFVLDGYNSKYRQDNSTLTLVVDMTLLSGDPCFKVPVQQKSQQILITDDGGDSELHLGNKGGTSEDGAGDSTLGSLTSNTSASPVPSSQTSLDQESRSLRVSETTIKQGHTRHASDQPKLSAYVSNSPASFHTRQNSADASLNSHRFASIGSMDHVIQTGSFPRPNKRNDATQVLAGERRLNMTRVDPIELVDELINGIDFNDKSATQGGGGLQLFVAKDGSAAVLGSARELQPPQSFKVVPPRTP